MALIKEDSQLYDHYRGIVNKRINDLRAIQDKGLEDQKRSAAVDTSDIERKINDQNVNPYEVLLMEFEPVGERQEHVVSGGKANVGQVTEKQTWSEFNTLFLSCNSLLLCSPTFSVLPLEHKHSDYDFQWHVPPGKKAFDRSRMWKAARRVVKMNKPGAVRIACILRLAKKETDTNSTSREEDMVKRVLAVMAVISSKVALSVLHDENLKLYIKSLDPHHKIPHHLEVQRITKVMVDVAMTEVTALYCG